MFLKTFCKTFITVWNIQYNCHAFWLIGSVVNGTIMIHDTIQSFQNCVQNHAFMRRCHASYFTKHFQTVGE